VVNRPPALAAKAKLEKLKSKSQQHRAAVLERDPPTATGGDSAAPSPSFPLRMAMKPSRPSGTDELSRYVDRVRDAYAEPKKRKREEGRPQTMKKKRNKITP